MHEYKPAQFAYYKFTSSLDIPATLVIKDLNTNDFVPIVELDLESCDISAGLSQLPM
ncbi:unnamed protein product, partial [Orchesella dallaii]